MFFLKNISYLNQYLFWNYLIYISYNPIHHLMDKYILNYRNIYPQHKKKYVISNLIKGLALGLNSHIGVRFLYNYIHYGLWDLKTIKMFGAIYAALDMTSMFHVEKMQTNTKIHHIMVQVLYLSGLVFYNFNKNSLANPMVIYAIYSALAYIVNIYLSLRIFIDNKSFLKKIKYLSYLIYICCCAQNWSYQLYFLTNNNNIPLIQKAVYSGIITSIVYDDWVLIKYLKK